MANAEFRFRKEVQVAEDINEPLSAWRKRIDVLIKKYGSDAWLSVGAPHDSADLKITEPLPHPMMGMIVMARGGAVLEVVYVNHHKQVNFWPLYKYKGEWVRKKTNEVLEFQQPQELTWWNDNIVGIIAADWPTGPENEREEVAPSGRNTERDCRPHYKDCTGSIGCNAFIHNPGCGEIEVGNRPPVRYLTLGDS